MEKKFIGSIDQGTTSTRFILFDHSGNLAASHQLEHKQYYPKPGWVEHDPLEIWENTKTTIKETLKKAGVSGDEIAGIGITNQRETIIAWDPATGRPLYNAIVWQDLRGKQFIDSLIEEGGIDRLRAKTGVPLSPYFSGSKIRWMMDNVEGLKERAENGEAYIGTIDTWLVWNLTGGKDGGALVTDVTNASRYLTMDIETLTWDDELLKLFSVPQKALPEIRSSMRDIYGYTESSSVFGAQIPVCGILGDQQAALFGQACFSKGQSKNTYGTGCFLLENTGEELCQSQYGLLTTVAYRSGDDKPVYALEGSIAVAGSLIQWMRDNIGLVDSAPEIDKLAESVEDNGGVYFVPAFAGLFAPYWRSDARGVITGLTGYVKAGHLARAVLESTAFQAKDLFDAMEKDSGIKLREIKVDGGMTKSAVFMQFQADILNIPVIRPVIAETTALGSAYAAGLSTGFWNSLEELAAQWKEDKHWDPMMGEDERDKKLAFWHKSIERSMNWIEE
ncbi:MAG: glycerol kinase GlpK [Spirochaetia bacterium]|nr:glycerol kinase GlpK [Spirochaetia bacterium]